MIRLEISTRAIVVLIVLAAAVWLFVRLWTLLLLVAVSLMLAAALLPLVEWMVRRGVRRGLAVLGVTLVMLASLALIGFVVAPSVVQQAQALIERLPDLQARVAQFLEQRRAFSLANEVRTFNLGQLIPPERIVSTGQLIIGALYSTVTVMVLTLYILLDARRVERFVYLAVPDSYHKHIRNVLPQLRQTVGGYIRGQLVTSFLISVYTAVVLTILGVPNALALAVVAAIGDMIPMVGGFLTVAPAALFSLPASLPKAALISILLLAYQEFENRVLVPRVYGSTMRLPALVVFVALLVGAELAGIIGALLSLPVASGLRVIVEYAYAVRAGRATAAVPAEDLGATEAETEAEEVTPGKRW